MEFTIRLFEKHENIEKTAATYRITLSQYKIQWSLG